MIALFYLWSTTARGLYWYNVIAIRWSYCRYSLNTSMCHNERCLFVYNCSNKYHTSSVYLDDRSSYSDYFISTVDGPSLSTDDQSHHRGVTFNVYGSFFYFYDRSHHSAVIRNISCLFFKPPDGPSHHWGATLNVNCPFLYVVEYW